MQATKYEEILKYAMNMEKTAEEFYKTYMSKVKAESNKEIFTQLAEMEDDHYEILEKELKKIQDGKEFDDFESLDLKDGEDIFKINERDIKDMNFDSTVEDLPILRMAYAMENDFATFYEKAAENVEDPNAKKLLEVLAKWEIQHRDSFDQEIKLATENSWFTNSFAPF